MSYLQEITLVDETTNISYSVRLPFDEIRRLERDNEYAAEVLRNVVALSLADGSTGPSETGLAAEQDFGLGLGGNEPATPSPTVSNQSPSGIDLGLVDDGFRWSNEAVLLLISLYEENDTKFSSPRHTNKSVWIAIATDFVSKGYQISWKQCETKWAGLKKVYKKMKDHNGKSGNDRKNWKYFDVMDNVLGNRPEMEPLSTADSSGNFNSSESCRAEKRQQPGDGNSQAMGSSSGNYRNDKQDGTPKAAKRKMSQQQMFDQMEANKAARHKERMEQNNKLMAILERMYPPGSHPTSD